MKNYYKMKPLVLGTVLSVLGFTGAFAQTAIPGTIDATVDEVAIVTSPGALSYQIDVAEAGDYYLELKYSSDVAVGTALAGEVVVKVDGTPVITSDEGFLLPSTIFGALPSQFLWAGRMEGSGLTTTVKTIPLAAGVQTLSLDVTTGGWELEAIRLLKDQVPFNGTPVEIGANGTFIIQAEEYDEGPMGVAYGDTGWGNDLGQFRGDGVDIGIKHEDTPFVLANVFGGEWTEYTINVVEAGDYTLAANYATPIAGAGIKISIDGTLLTTLGFPSTVPDGGATFLGWRTYGTAVSEIIALEAGVQVLNIEANNRQNLNFISLTKATSTFSNEVLKANEVAVYPNPSASGIFNLGQVENYVVYSTTGAEILSGKGSKINLSAFPQGLYLLKVADKTIKLLYN